VSRLSVGQVAILLERVRSAGMQSEADQISAHIDQLTEENKFLEHIQTVAAHIAQSTLAEQATASILEGWKTIFTASAVALQALADVEMRKVSLDENKYQHGLDLEKEGLVSERQTVNLRYVHIWGPIVVALTGVISAAAAYYFATGAPTP